MRKVFIVTGANGFLGNNIVRKLVERNVEVRCLVLPNDNVKALEGLNCKIYKGDVTKKNTLDEIFDIPEEVELYVIHCAAIVYIKAKYNPKVMEVNYNGTKNVIDKVIEKNAKMIYVSSVHAITEKENNEKIEEIYDFDPNKVVGQYAKSKARTAKMVLEEVKTRNLNACIIHPSGIIGPRDYSNTHLTQMIIDVAKGSLRACVKGGYDFVDVRDVADGILKACEKGKKGECYILSNKYIEVRELVDLVSKYAKVGKIKTVLPMWFAKLTAPLSEMYYKIRKEAPLYTKYSLYTLTSNANFSNEKAKKELGYTNRLIEDTIKDTVKWLKEEGKI